MTLLYKPKMNAIFALFWATITSCDGRSTAAFSTLPLPTSNARTAGAGAGASTSSTTVAMSSNYGGNNLINSRGGRKNFNGQQQSQQWDSQQQGGGQMMMDDGYGYYDSYSPNPFYDEQRLFGNGKYYNNDSSEDFRRVSRNDRERRREGMRYGSPSGYGDERAFGGRRQDGGNFGYSDRQYGGAFGSEDFRGNRGNRNNSRGRVGGGGGGGRMQDYFTPGERERYQQQDNQGARYGWQQQYDMDRGTVRNGSSNDFRKGSAFSRMQDYTTPKQREIWQRQDNQGARYGWQQQYDMDRGNVRNGSSNDFRRGSSFDRYQDYATPREREMRQMRDNRSLGRGRGQEYGRNNGGSYGRNNGGSFGRNNGGGYGQEYYGQNGVEYGQDYGQNGGGYGGGDYYDPEIVGMNSGGGNYRPEPAGRRFRNSMRNFKGFFNTGF